MVLIKNKMLESLFAFVILVSSQLSDTGLASYQGNSMSMEARGGDIRICANSDAIPSPEESEIINKDKIEQANASKFDEVKRLDEDGQNKTVGKIIRERGLKPKDMISSFKFKSASQLPISNSYLVTDDHTIEEFLNKFINNMVANVKMLVDFVIQLLKDSLSGK